MKTPADKDLHTLDMITREVGLLDIEDGHVMPHDRRWAEEVVASLHARIAVHQRNRSPKVVPPIKKAAPITERLKALPRDALEALFGSLVDAWGPQAQFAHRHLDQLSDNDLRRIVQTLETHAKRG